MTNDGAAETAKAVRLFNTAARKLESEIRELENGGRIREAGSLSKAILDAARGVDRLYSRAAKGEIAGDAAASAVCSATCDRLHALRVECAERGQAYRGAKFSAAVGLAAVAERAASTRTPDAATAGYHREVALARAG